MARWAWRALLWWFECALMRVLAWLQRHDIASLHIVQAEHTLGGAMEIREGGRLAVNVVAKNIHGRVIDKPEGLVVSLNGSLLTPDADGSYAVAAAGQLRASVGILTVAEDVTLVPDNAVARLEFIQAADGTQTPVDVTVSA